MKFFCLQGFLTFLILFIRKSKSSELKYSCADYMVDTYNDKLVDGYYNITLNASYSDSITVYCHFNYTTQYAWTLIESFSRTYASYPRYYAFYENYAYLQDYVETYRNSRYRMSSTWMQSIFESMFSKNETGHKNPRKMMSTCNFDTSLDRDYLIINLDDPNLQYNPLYDYWYSYTCLRMEEINIRGYTCQDEDIYAYNSGYHFFVASDSYYCNCEPWASTASSSEDNFGYYYSYNSAFTCAASSSSTTNWWLGRYVPYNEPKPWDQYAYTDFVSFQNITAKDISGTYKIYEDIKLNDCLDACKWDYAYNDNNTCRFFIYLDSHKGEDDSKCFFFTKENWSKFGDVGQYSDDSEMVYAVDFDLRGYSYPSDWIDKYNDDCVDYEEHGWCIDQETTQSYDKFYNLRDRNKYNKTAIDVCMECGGGIAQYNETNMSAVIGLPVYSDLGSFVDSVHDDLLCYLDFDTIEDYYYYNESIYNSTEDNNILNGNLQIESFDKVNLYSICYQYFTKLTNFYNNSDQSGLEWLTKLVNCDVFSLTTNEFISIVNTSLCEFSSVVNDSNINDHINFIFAIGYNGYGNLDKKAQLQNKNTSANNSIHISPEFTYNVYLNSLWVDFESIITLSNDYDTIYTDVNYYDCEQDIFEPSNHEYSSLVLPCSMQSDYFSDISLSTTDEPVTGVRISKYSCADWMYNSFAYKIEYDTGYFEIEHKNDYYPYNSRNMTVYCVFDYDTQYAYTLIESGSRLFQQEYLRYCAFNEDCPQNADNVRQWRNYNYRLNFTWVESIYESMSNDINPNFYIDHDRKLISTCNFDTSLDRDYLIINLDDPNLQYNPLYDYWYGYTCLLMEEINIRGYTCQDENIYAYNNGYHFYVDSDSSYCDCEPWVHSASYSEDNFGFYSYFSDGFNCSTSSSSTTNWWLGRYVPDNSGNSVGTGNSTTDGAHSTMVYYHDYDDDDDGDDNEAKHIGGIVMGVALGCFVAGLILVIWFVYRHSKSKHREVEAEHAGALERRSSLRQVRSTSGVGLGANVVYPIAPSAPSAPNAPPSRARNVVGLTLGRNANDDNDNGLGLCTICQDDLNSTLNPKPLVTLGCDHVFHEQCWTDFKASMANGARNATCPNCRRSVY